MTALPEAILFDLDETILDFDGPVAAAWRAAVEAVAGRFGGVPAEAVQAQIGRVSSAYWSDPERHRRGRLALHDTRTRNVADALAHLGIADGGLSRRIALDYHERRTAAIQPFPGAVETLAHFRDRGVRLALVTNGDSAGQRAKVERFGLAPFFDGLVVEEEFGAGKPDERVFRHALATLGAAPEAAWMVGDSLEWEIEPCRRLGLHTVWVDGRGGGLPPGAGVEPHRTVRSIRELMAEPQGTRPRCSMA